MDVDAAASRMECTKGMPCPVRPPRLSMPSLYRANTHRCLQTVGLTLRRVTILCFQGGPDLDHSVFSGSVLYDVDFAGACVAKPCPACAPPNGMPFSFLIIDGANGDTSRGVATYNGTAVRYSEHTRSWRSGPPPTPAPLIAALGCLSARLCPPADGGRRGYGALGARPRPGCQVLRRHELVHLPLTDPPLPLLPPAHLSALELVPRLPPRLPRPRPRPPLAAFRLTPTLAYLPRAQVPGGQLSHAQLLRAAGRRALPRLQRQP